MTSTTAQSSTTQEANNKPSMSARIRNSIPLFLLIILIFILGFVSPFFYGECTHWMTGPGIATMTIFMPLTAISYLHFRLPKKQEEFKSIKKALRAENDESENFTIVLNQDDSGADYLLPLFFVSFFSLLGFYILFADSAAVLFNGMEWVQFGPKNPCSQPSAMETEIFRRSVLAAGMAFLGAYVWSVQYIFRRMMTLDLPPGAYYSVGSRMVYSSFLAVVVQHFMVGKGQPTSELLSTQIVAVSFLVGIFPERVLSWMKESLGRIFSRKSIAADPLPLEMIEGISGFHKARLSELGIDNVQNLAQASLLELMLKTPFRPRVLIDWVAQARLCIEFKDKIGDIRRAGIRTILDLQEVADSEERLLAVAQLSGVDIHLIQTICLTNKDEKSVNRLRKAYDVLNMI